MAQVMGLVLVLGAIGAVAWVVISLDPRAERADDADGDDRRQVTDVARRPSGPSER